MTSENKHKINQLLKAALKDSVLTTSWLKEQGISNKLAWWYVKSGWFERIADGAYGLTGNNITWAGAISAVQQQLKLPIYPGGKTALELLGKGHYLTRNLQIIQLFAAPKTKIPRWLHSSYWKESFMIYCPALFNTNNNAWLAMLEIAGQSIMVSSPEKASLELCYLVPNIVTFSEAALIIEGLPRMRPKLLQSLLEACQSYKAKRLLLYLAEYFQHPWTHEIELSRVDFGKGKRVIAGGGQYNDKYKISVPALGNNE
ncbi:MAG: type IV toxin-antitoxin system AbiEi family antitoxin [Legionellales bacterium]|nr:type IV toxin-antitoxin system AbiEi family antitoxin [Legionellales bacterium]